MKALLFYFYILSFGPFLEKCHPLLDTKFGCLLTTKTWTKITYSLHALVLVRSVRCTKYSPEPIIRYMLAKKSIMLRCKKKNASFLSMNATLLKKCITHTLFPMSTVILINKSRKSILSWSTVKTATWLVISSVTNKNAISSQRTKSGLFWYSFFMLLNIVMRIIIS